MSGINILIYADKAQKIVKEVSGADMKEINSRITEAAKLGDTSILWSASHNFTDNMKDAIELRGYSTERDESGNITISWEQL